jgi:hypothetical protein
MSLAIRPASLILAALLGAPLAASAVEPGGCTGTLAGAVTARFACTVTTRIEGTVATLVVAVDGPVAGVRSLKPGTVSLAVPIPSGSYSGEALKGAAASLETTSGVAYAAGAGRGEVTLVVDQAEPYRQAPNHLVVSGSLKARLVPAKAGQEVVVEVRF